MLTSQKNELSDQDRIAFLEAENAALKKENAALKKENEAFRKEISEVKAQLKSLQQLLFGQSTERSGVEAKDEDLHKDEDKSQDKNENKESGRRGQNNREKKRRQRKHLPVKEVIVDILDAEKLCSKCGEPLKPFIDTVEGDTVEIEVKAHRRRVRRKTYIRTCKCTGTPKTKTAPSPGKLVPRGSIGISVWVKLLLSKFQFYSPTNRIIQELELYGIDLPNSTISDGMKRLKDLLQPIYAAFCVQNRQEEQWYADETTWPVYEKVEGKKTSRWYLWVYKAAYTVIYRLNKSRSAEELEEHLGSVVGTITCDRYSAYKKYAKDSGGDVSLAYCWAHVRRDYIRLGRSYPEHREWTEQVVEVEIKKLYVLHALRREAYEQDANGKAYHNENTKFLETINRFYKMREAELESGNLAECQEKVNLSLMEHWHGLTEVTANPELDMDNNAAERALRGPVVGRKNFWGSMMEWSGELAAMMFTIIQTLLLWGINPLNWFTSYFKDCAANKGKSPSDISVYLPWNMSNEKLEALAQPKGTSETISDPPT